MERCFLFVILILVIMAAGCSLKQVFLIEGTVCGSNDARIPGATVTVNSPGFSVSVFSDETGYYSCQVPLPGVYNLTAEKDTFNTETVNVDDITPVNIVLKTGEGETIGFPEGFTCQMSSITSPTTAEVKSLNSNSLPGTKNLSKLEDFFKALALQLPMETDLSREVTDGYRRELYIKVSLPLEQERKIKGIRIYNAQNPFIYLGYSVFRTDVLNVSMKSEFWSNLDCDGGQFVVSLFSEGGESCFTDPVQIDVQEPLIVLSPELKGIFSGEFTLKNTMGNNGYTVAILSQGKENSTFEYINGILVWNAGKGNTIAINYVNVSPN